MKTNPKARMGRPLKGAENLMSPIMIRLPPAMVAEIQAISASRMDAPDRSSLIRELLAEAMAARRLRRQ